MQGKDRREVECGERHHPSGGKWSVSAGGSGGLDCVAGHLRERFSHDVHVLSENSGQVPTWGCPAEDVWGILFVSLSLGGGQVSWPRLACRMPAFQPPPLWLRTHSDSWLQSLLSFQSSETTYFTVSPALTSYLGHWLSCLNFKLSLSY